MGLKCNIMLMFMWPNQGHAVDHAVEVETDTLGEGLALDFCMGQEHGLCHNHPIEVTIVVSAIVMLFTPTFIFR